MSSKWADAYQKRKAYFEAYSAKRYEQKRLIRQQKRIERASLPPKPRKRLAPFAEVGRRGGAVSPHSKCVPCLSSLGASRRRVSQLTGIDQSTLKAHGFEAIPIKDRIAIAHAGKRLIRGKCPEAPKRVNDIAIIEMEIRKERRECRRIDRMWEKHPETMRWVGRMNAARQWVKWKDDPQFRVAKACRSRIYKFVKSRSERTNELLGCSFQEFVKWLESKFEFGMSWDNYGDWEIDHVIPCSAFDLTDSEQRRKCFHYTNTQPMWWKDNIVKGSSYNGRKHRHVGAQVPQRHLFAKQVAA